MNEKEVWIWLSRIEGLNSVKLKALLDKYKRPSVIEKLDKLQLLSVKGFDEKIANEILNSKYKQGLEQYVDYMSKHNIELINIMDKQYPAALKRIYDAPSIIYVKGNKEILNSFCIAIVGSRLCSKYGEKVVKNISSELAKYGIVIVSGLAKGIDSSSHIGCIQSHGKTIAVLGNSLDIIYPPENKYLADKILTTGGAIISEYVIGSKINKMNFPARNRIISGISKGVVVAEARQRSGALITVDFALEQGREVFAIPGNIDNYNSKGTNKLIQDGAKLVTSAKDILEEFNINFN